MALNSKGKGELIVHGIGVCASQPSDKKTPYIFVAYSTALKESSVKFTAMEFPDKNTYLPQDFLYAIARTEGVADVTYIDDGGKARDIYVCRENEGKVYDFVERDRMRQEFADGFAEIAAGYLKFGITNSLDVKIKPFTHLEYAVNTSQGNYPKGSVEYAVINAYNACLLARVFGKEDLRLETKYGDKVKIEVRKNTSPQVNVHTLYVEPVAIGPDDTIDHYLTEEFYYIDDRGKRAQQYKIAYTRNTGEYFLARTH